jgi:hypothetical protein
MLKATEGKRLTLRGTKKRFGVDSGKYVVQTILFPER